MHLGGDRTRRGAMRRVARPAAPTRELGHVFADRERLPYADRAVQQDRHPSRGGELRDLGLELGRVELELPLGELEAEMPEQQPRPQGPGTVVAAADDEQ